MSHRRGARHYRLEHRSTYAYPEPVTSSYGRAVLLPSDVGGQRVHRSRLAVTPTPAEAAEHRDVSGNRSSYFHVTAEHTVLEVVATSVVTVSRRRPDPATVPQLPWEQVVAAVSGIRATGRGEQGEGPGSVVAIVESALPSQHVAPDEEVLEYALPSFSPGTPLVRVVADLSRRIHHDIAYRPGTTAVGTRLPELLAQRSGVCQDLTHLLIACLRVMGLSARYVSGYVETPSAREERDDAPHAWAAVWLPGGGWIHVDPTNDRMVDDRYVQVGWGRDHADVSPLRGIVRTFGPGADLSVEIDLAALTTAELDRELHG
ncbi:transglutaminase family protein [Georgenia subflava]|uniref:Transglutaminase family protein n=1 Tax=Georgenia subflava TaxID=1622177 RepID=A0A6N7EJN4_9MICO|nr:transglutaminase family protein [Georgenia subflava]MPV38300.1 transglutaminase family protein [Georgenia subflava]